MREKWAGLTGPSAREKMEHDILVGLLVKLYRRDAGHPEVALAQAPHLLPEYRRFAQALETFLPPPADPEEVEGEGEREED
ncbi:MAG: hypothetical protein ACC662_02500, partial [Planctomycetota bacterium]